MFGAGWIMVMMMMRKMSCVSGCITIMGMDRVTRAVTAVEQAAQWLCIKEVRQSRADLGGQ